MLERAILAHASRNGITATVVEAQATPWASATFAGARHRLTLNVEGDARSWVAGLSEADLTIRRHLVADLVVEDQCKGNGWTTATIGVLTVEDR